MNDNFVFICEDISDDLLYLSSKIFSKSKQIEEFDKISSFEEEILLLKEVVKRLDELQI